MDIYLTRHLGHGRRVCGFGENDSGNIFASSFLRKDKNPLTHRKSSKYYAGQEIWTETPESSDVSIGELIKLPAGERRTGLGRDGGRGIHQFRPPMDTR